MHARQFINDEYCIQFQYDHLHCTLCVKGGIKHVAPGKAEVPVVTNCINETNDLILEKAYERPIKKHKARSIVNYSDVCRLKIESILRLHEINSCTNWILSELQKGIKNGEDLHVRALESMQCYTITELKLFFNECNITDNFVNKSDAVNIFCQVFQIDT